MKDVNVLGEGGNGLHSHLLVIFPFGDPSNIDDQKGFRPKTSLGLLLAPFGLCFSHNSKLWMTTHL
jgi:hypothetical protein